MKQALVKIHLAVFLWGFTGVLGKGIALNEGLLVWYRILITLITLLLLQSFKVKPKKISTRHSRQLLANGTLLALHWSFFYGSIKYSNVSIALTCLSASGLFTAVLEPVFNKKRIVFAEVLLGLLGITGICLIFHFDPHFKTGIVLGLIASVLICLYTIFSEKQIIGNSASTVMLYQLGGGFIVLTLLMPAYLYYFPSDNLWPRGFDWPQLLIMSWLCTIIAMNLALDSLKHLSAFTQNITMNFEPVYGIILAFIIFKEQKELSTGFFIGFGLIALAVIIQIVRIARHSRDLQ